MGLKYTILGGDKRSLELGNLLMKDGNDVCIYGFDRVEQVIKTKQVNTK